MLRLGHLLVAPLHLEASMDPANQPPGQPTPPWGTASQPEEPQPEQSVTPPWAAPEPVAPSWAAPGPVAPLPEPVTPPWAAPGQPNTPPWGTPGQPGAPQPGWVGQQWPPAPQKSGGNGKRIAVVAIVAVVVIGALLAFAALHSSPDLGKVVFSTDAPTDATTGCEVSHQATTVSATTSVYATYIYTDTQGSGVVTLAISKDGTDVSTPIEVPTADTSGADCTADNTDLSTLPGWGAGTWKFTLTSGGKTVSEGSLVVTP